MVPVTSLQLTDNTVSFAKILQTAMAWGDSLLGAYRITLQTTAISNLKITVKWHNMSWALVEQAVTNLIL